MKAVICTKESMSVSPAAEAVGVYAKDGSLIGIACSPLEGFSITAIITKSDSQFDEMRRKYGLPESV